MKTEYKKMMSCQLYNARDPHLVGMRDSARQLLARINGAMVDLQGEEKKRLCSELFAAFGTSSTLQPPFYCDYGRNIILGDDVFINFNCIFLDVAPITVGNHVQIGPNVQVYTATHPLDWQTREAGLEYGRPIVIEDHVWIGGSAVICPGVTIGARSVIGAGSVVTRDVPPETMVAGNPAKILKKL